MNYIVLTGNPVDGLIFYGPFDEFDAAEDWAQKNMAELDWWVAMLDSPHT